MKILIVKTSSLGDIIHTFGVVDYLYRRFNQVQIDWVVEAPFAELVRAHPYVHRVLRVESKKWRKNFLKYRGEFKAFCRALKKETYDYAFDLQGNLKSSAFLFHAKAPCKVGFGWKTVPEWPNTLFTNKRFNPPDKQNIRDDYLFVVQSFFKDKALFCEKPVSLKLNPLEQQRLADLFRGREVPTLVCPSSAWPNKCLSAKQLIGVLKQIERKPFWFAWGNAHEREMAISLAGNFPKSAVLERLSLPLLQHVMAKCGLVVAMDSLPLHLCGTTATPSLSFFGPSSAFKYKPKGDQHQALQGSCPYGEEFEKRCSKLRSCASGACLREVVWSEHKVLFKPEANTNRDL